MRVKRIIAIALVPLFLPACGPGNKQGTGTIVGAVAGGAAGAAIGGKNNRIPGIAIGAMAGGLLGNLMDNACKWAKARVVVEAKPVPGAKRFAVAVDDDGPGLTEAERKRAMKRGQRLDESKPGSGLGLSIVADLAHLYKGRFELEPSPDGGLRARLTLPAA